MQGPELPLADRTAYRRGQILGFTIAEFFLVLSFLLLLLLTLYFVEAQNEQERISAIERAIKKQGLDLTVDQILTMLADAEENAAEVDRLKEQLSEALSALAVAQVQLADAEQQLSNLTPLVDATEALGSDLPDDFIELVEGLAQNYASDDSSTLTSEQVLAVVESITDQWVASNLQIAESLQNEFGTDLAGWQAEIDAGQLVFRFTDPDVLFESGSAELRHRFQNILTDFCPRFLRLLSGFGDHIEEVRIEGHTSSEWEGVGPLGAYFNNMGLSQARTRAVLEFCLQLDDVAEIGPWPQSTLVAVGMSSSKLIENDQGQENRQGSRRVELRIVTDADRQIGEIIQTLNEREN